MANETTKSSTEALERSCLSVILSLRDKNNALTVSAILNGELEDESIEQIY